MPQLSRSEPVPSPAETVEEMIEGFLNNPQINVQEKLSVLRELCVERITFGSPEQAIRIISALARIIGSDPEPEVRVAALEAMERMIDLQHKAEAEQGKPRIDWHKVNVLLHEARKQTELDRIPVASRFGAPSPETASPLPANTAAIAENDFIPPEDHAVAREADDISPADAALLAVQESAVAAIKKADVHVVPLVDNTLAAEAVPAVVPAPPRGRDQAAVVSAIPGAQSPKPAAGEKPDPPLMKFLRSVADTEKEEHIRALANRIITKIENLTALQPRATPAPALKEG